MIFRQDKKAEAEPPNHEPPPSADAGIHPGAFPDSNTYFVVQRPADGLPKIQICQGDQEAQTILETLLTDGVAKEAIDLYRGSKSQFTVEYKPVVKLST